MPWTAAGFAARSHKTGWEFYRTRALASTTEAPMQRQLPGCGMGSEERPLLASPIDVVGNYAFFTCRTTR